MFKYGWELERRDDQAIGREELGAWVWSHSWPEKANICVSDLTFPIEERAWSYSAFTTYTAHVCACINYWKLGWEGGYPAVILPITPALSFPYTDKKSVHWELNQEYERLIRVPARLKLRRSLALRR